MLGIATRCAVAVATPALGVLLAACATKPPEAPKDYVLAAGGIGVAVTAASVRAAPTAGSRAGSGAAGGAIAVMQGAVFLGPLAILLAPVGAIAGATLEGACGKKFTDAYPSLVTDFEGEARRELLSGDISDSVIDELQKRTSMPVVALQAVPPATEVDQAQILLSDAAQRDLAYALVVTPTVALIPYTNDCVNAVIRVWLSAALWDVRTKGKVPLRPSSGYWDRLDVVVSFNELQVLLEGQGALRSRFLPFYASWASGLHTNAGFVLPAP